MKYQQTPVMVAYNVTYVDFQNLVLDNPPFHAAFNLDGNATWANEWTGMKDRLILVTPETLLTYISKEMFAFGNKDIHRGINLALKALKELAFGTLVNIAPTH